MQLNRSHGRLAIIGAIVSIPVILGFGSGIWITHESHLRLQQREETSRLRQVSSQAQMLLEMVKTEIESFRAQTQVLLNTESRNQSKNSNQNSFQNFEKILHWAEIEYVSPKVGRVKSYGHGPHWTSNSNFEETYLSSAIETIQLDRVKQTGLGILRIKKDVSGSSEWLSLVFPVQGSENSVRLALIDPSSAFNSFQTWGTHSQGGHSRGYLIGSDGRVLSHSQKTLAWADFSGMPFFQKVILRAFNGTISAGAGDFFGVDQLRVGSAFYRVGQLPLGVVVEQVNAVYVDRTQQLWIAGLGLICILVLAIATLGCALFLKSYLVQVVTLTIPAQTHSDLATEPSFEQVPAEKRFFSSDELLILDSMRHSNDNSTHL